MRERRLSEGTGQKETLGLSGISKAQLDKKMKKMGEYCSAWLNFNLKQGNVPLNWKGPYVISR